MKDAFYKFLFEIIDRHARTFELFAFTIVFVVLAVLIESLGFTTVTTNAILTVGGSATIIAICAGAINEI